MKTYNVEKLIDFRSEKGLKLFKVKWEGYPMDQCTWEPASNLTNFRDQMKELE